MALEDVVQGVDVKVEIEGVDQATSQISGLQKAIENLADSAGKSSGSGGGLGGLQTAFKNIGTTAADSFLKSLAAQLPET